ncbi:MAG: hypothetical protein F4130_09505 [Acidobacteria bacterium]|nr:hypothetical protein [Acidobacteriota bacterium]MYH22501.1 hypothetical protein [Acidobacteriota bacterium]
MWTLLPFVVAGILFVPWLQTAWKAVFSAAVSCGLLTLLMHVGRHTGRDAQDRLFRVWDGTPSAAMLRHRDTRIQPTTKARYRAFLERSIPNLKLASPGEESADPDRAEDGYASATSWLRAQTRDRRRFGLLFSENVSYGFRRNVWALKPFALGLDAAILAVAVAQIVGIWTGCSGNWLADADAASWIVVALATLHAATYLTWIRPNWVRPAAESYARQLLAACDALEYEESCRKNAP